jgi:hypothetical protein
MFCHALRHFRIALLLGAAGLMICRIPTLWHSHGGGKGGHSHATNSDLQGEESHAHGHSHAGHDHSHGGHHHHHRHGGHEHHHVHTADDDSHTHSHGAEAREEDLAETASADSGWHMHVSLFGFELTISAPFDDERDEPLFSLRKPEDDDRELARRTRQKHGPSSSRGGTWRSPPDQWVTQIMGIEFGPLPRALACPISERHGRVFNTRSSLFPRDADSPPVPPPRPA